MSRPVRYVALGDSYTIGTSVAASERFPDQLVARLTTAGTPEVRLVANLAVNGYTTADLIRDELPMLARLAPDLLTLLIGVNDVVQGVPLARYRANVARILDTLVSGRRPDRIVVVAIPDYTVTPAGADYGDPAAQSDRIVAANAAMASETAARGMPFVDVFDISLEAAGDPGLVADDGLHPSGEQYARWVGRIAPVVARSLGR